MKELTRQKERLRSTNVEVEILVQMGNTLTPTLTNCPPTCLLLGHREHAWESPYGQYQEAQGYSDLFCSEQGGLMEVLSEYPQAQAIMEEKGREILLKMNKLDVNAEAAEIALQEATEARLRGLDQQLDDLQTKSRLDSLAELESSALKIAYRIERLEWQTRSGQCLRNSRRLMTRVNLGRNAQRWRGQSWPGGTSRPRVTPCLSPGLPPTK